MRKIGAVLKSYTGRKWLYSAIWTFCLTSAAVTIPWLLWSHQSSRAEWLVTFVFITCFQLIRQWFVNDLDPYSISCAPTFLARIHSGYPKLGKFWLSHSSGWDQHLNEQVFRIDHSFSSEARDRLADFCSRHGLTPAALQGEALAAYCFLRDREQDGCEVLVRTPDGLMRFSLSDPNQPAQAPTLRVIRGGRKNPRGAA